MATMVDSFNLNRGDDFYRWQEFKLRANHRIVDLGGDQLHIWTGPIREIEAEYTESSAEPMKLQKAKGQAYTLHYVHKL